MAYEAEISRNNPTAFIFLIDQSGSMADTMSIGKSKAEFLADVLNKTLMNLTVRCSKSEGVRDYFYVGLIGYNQSNVHNCFKDELSKSYLNPISKVADKPIKIEERIQKIDDGTGNIIERKVKFPVWLEATANGGTPMCQALKLVYDIVDDWCKNHKNSYPPTILHITDGESTDGDPSEIAEAIKKEAVNDGNALLFNLHISIAGGEPIIFPSNDSTLPDEFAKLLFNMSSFLPEHLIEAAKERGFNISENARGFIYNGEASEIVEFFDIGTRATQMR